MKKAITLVVAFLHLIRRFTVLCSICQKDFIGDIHNAMPITPGACCTSCNNDVVIPFRLYQLGTNSKEALVLDSSYKLSIIKPASTKFTLEELQSHVQGYIQYYPSHNKKYSIIVNEEGLLLRLSDNALSKRIFGIHAIGIQNGYTG